MTSDAVRGFRIRKGSELVNTPVPDIPYRILGLLRANGGRLSITGPYKSEKSLLAQSMAMKIAKGEDWLGFRTIPGNVLYVNTEISEEMFQQRTQDFYYALGYDVNNLTRFSTATILDSNLALDMSVNLLQMELDKSKENGFKVDTLFLDPRARLIAHSENDEVTIKGFCDHIDLLLSNNPGLSVVIVTHMGKDPTKGAIGHSRYSGWLDTEITIVKRPDMICNKELEIVGRDVERSKISLTFSYPQHTVVAVEEALRKTKVHTAKEFILARLSTGAITEQQLRRESMTSGISSYAFTTALSELKDEARIELDKAGGQGNRKIIRLAGKGVTDVAQQKPLTDGK